MIRALEVGVCGTDREICEGLFGVSPGDDPFLVLGHELCSGSCDGAGTVASSVRTSGPRSGSSSSGESPACPARALQ